MDNTLWIFGDSFGADDMPYELPGMDQQWHRVLGDRLGMDRKNMAASGSSLDYLYYKWYSVEHMMKPGDLAIVTATEPSRRWLVKSNPSYTSPARLAQGDYEKILDKNILQAMRTYFRYLDHPSLEEAHFYNWLGSADRTARRGVKVLVMASFPVVRGMIVKNKSQFPHVGYASGTLLNVSMDECTASIRQHMMANEWRLNHLSLVNHDILVDKIAEWYRSSKPLDLFTGFKQGFIDSYDKTLLDWNSLRG